MAKKKDSPWFKFKVNDWITGDIQDLSPQLKGIFIDLCAYYWSKDCDVSYDKAAKKIGKKHLERLVSADILKKTDRSITIDFLNEQWRERNKTSEQNRENGKAGAASRWGEGMANAIEKNSDQMATAIKTDGETYGIKKEKENKKEKEIAPPSIYEKNFAIIFPHGSEQFLKLWIEWVNNRAAMKKPYQTDSQQLHELQELGKYPEIKACEMIRTAMRNGWKNLRPLNDDQKSGRTSDPKKATSFSFNKGYNPHV